MGLSSARNEAFQMSNRDLLPEELQTLKETLIRVLPGADKDQMTAMATEAAKAIRLAFDELTKERPSPSSSP